MTRRLYDLPSFDTLKQLAQKNPEALEDLRLSLTQEVIDCARSNEQKRRLEGLKFKIDMNRRKAKNPMQSCLKLSQLMWDSALDMSDKMKK